MNSRQESLSLVCPRDKQPLTMSIDHELSCSRGHIYTVFRGIPILLISEADPTHASCWTSGKRVADEGEWMEDDWEPTPESPVHPAVQAMVSAAGGYLYQGLVNKLREYPIPDIRLTPSKGGRMLDLGCNWGRWTVSAARKGYRVIGIDPDLGAVLAARKVARQLGVSAEFVVGDARYLPFADGSFDTVFSYSVLQHLSKCNVELTLREVDRVLDRTGKVVIQMPNKFGLRSLYHQARRFGKSQGIFDVRYWSPLELKRTFCRCIGPSSLSVDGFFGLGIQPSDLRLIPWHLRPIIVASECLRLSSLAFPPLIAAADSLYVVSEKRGETAPTRASPGAD
jgi:2-polyprenyl-3-methyl-5-hydroxy-6-metoxy-1,4-benzoquinol methylase/uncharacterized protein YbaR (Trm112 family)